MFTTWCWARASSADRPCAAACPLYKYISNRFLTAFENLFLRVKLSEYHTGYRAFNSKVLTTLPLMENSHDFVFDNQMLAQCVYFGFRIGEVSCPTKYFEEASSINFRRSVKYGLGVLLTSLQFAFTKVGADASAALQPAREKARPRSQASCRGRGVEPGRSTDSPKSFGWTTVCGRAFPCRIIRVEHAFRRAF